MLVSRTRCCFCVFVSSVRGSFRLCVGCHHASFEAQRVVLLKNFEIVSADVATLYLYSACSGMEKKIKRQRRSQNWMLE